MKLVNENGSLDLKSYFGERSSRGIYCWSQPELDGFFQYLNMRIQDWPLCFFMKSVRNSFSEWQKNCLRNSDAALIFIDKDSYNDLEYVELGVILGSFVRVFIYIDKDVFLNQNIIDLIHSSGVSINKNVEELSNDVASWASEQLVENVVKSLSISVRAGVR